MQNLAEFCCRVQGAALQSGVCALALACWRLCSRCAVGAVEGCGGCSGGVQDMIQSQTRRSILHQRLTKVVVPISTCVTSQWIVRVWSHRKLLVSPVRANACKRAKLWLGRMTSHQQCLKAYHCQLATKWSVVATVASGTCACARGNSKGQYWLHGTPYCHGHVATCPSRPVICASSVQLCPVQLVGTIFTRSQKGKCWLVSYLVSVSFPRFTLPRVTFTQYGNGSEQFFYFSTFNLFHSQLRLFSSLRMSAWHSSKVESNQFDLAISTKVHRAHQPAQQMNFGVKGRGGKFRFRFAKGLSQLHCWKSNQRN